MLTIIVLAVLASLRSALVVANHAVVHTLGWLFEPDVARYGACQRCSWEEQADAQDRKEGMGRYYRTLGSESFNPPEPVRQRALVVVSLAISAAIVVALIGVATLYVVAMIGTINAVEPTPERVATRIIACPDQHATYWNGEPRVCMEYAAR